MNATTSSRLSPQFEAADESLLTSAAEGWAFSPGHPKYSGAYSLPNRHYL